MTIKEFTKEYFDLLSIRFPNAEFKIVDDITIHSKFDHISIKISVDNAYREYQSKSDSLQVTLNKYVSSVGESFITREKINTKKIVPIIKPIEYLNDSENSKKGTEDVYEKYNDQLIIVYAEDTENSIKYVTQNDIKSLSLEIDSLRSIATKNFANLLTNIQIKRSNEVYMLTVGGDYEASLILIENLFTKEYLPVDGDFVVAIPNRDMLLITGSNDLDGISKIKGIAKKSFETGNYPVSECLYKWNGQKFEKCE